MGIGISDGLVSRQVDQFDRPRSWSLRCKTRRQRYRQRRGMSAGPHGRSASKRVLFDLANTPRKHNDKVAGGSICRLAPTPIRSELVTKACPPTLECNPDISEDDPKWSSV